MRRFLICSGVHARPECLELLRKLVDRRRPDAVLFAGGVLASVRQFGQEASPWGLRREDAIFLDRFFETLGRLDVFCAVIPGPRDCPLDEFLRLGMHAEIEYRGVHLAHATLLEQKDLALCGVGGCLSAAGAHELETCSRTMIEYHLRSLWTSTRPYKTALITFPCTGRLGGAECEEFVGELIDSYHPQLFVVAGPLSTRGVRRVAHTTVVTPGNLSEGSAAWVDRDRPRGDQAELLEFRDDLANTFAAGNVAAN